MEENCGGGTIISSRGAASAEGVGGVGRRCPFPTEEGLGGIRVICDFGLNQSADGDS